MGKVTIYDGSSGAVLWEDFGAAAGDKFGSSIAGDGSIIVVGAPGKTSLCGCSSQTCDRSSGYVGIYAASSTKTLIAQVGGQQGGGLGTSVSIVGDIHGNDGVSEVIAGEPYANLDYFNYYTIGPCGFKPQGQFKVIDGATGAVILTVSGSSYGYRLGTVVSGFGDVNGDGIPDFGAAGGGNASQTDYPKLVIYSGAGPTYPFLRQRNLYPYLGYGPTSIVGIPLSGYSCNGILIGQPPAADGAGQIQIMSGGCNNWADLSIINAPAGAAAFGSSISAIGDANGDFIVGAPGTSKGKAYVISGESFGVISSMQSTTAGTDSFGQCVNGKTGTINGTPIPWYIVGAPNTSDLYQNRGSAFTFAGTPGPTPTPFVTPTTIPNFTPIPWQPVKILLQSSVGP